MSFGALQLKVSGSVMPAAPSGAPTIVQVGVTAGNQASNTSELITFPAAPKATHKLVVAAYSGVGTPSVDGFNAIASLTPSSKMLYWFAKVSDGTEQTITVSFSANSASHGCAAVELDANATLGDAYATKITLAATGNVIGPSSTPAQQGTPLLFGFFDGPSDTSVWTWPSGWSGAGPDNGGNQFPYCGSVMASGPVGGSAFTITVTRPSTRGNTTAFYWSNLWIYPA